MSRSVKGVREVLQHSKSGSQQIVQNDDEKYNFVKDGHRSSNIDTDHRSRIESLEYDISILTDRLTASQRNYDNVSRLLKQERDKDMIKDRSIVKRNDELEMMVNIEATRAKDLIERLKAIEKDKAHIEDISAFKDKEQKMEVARLNGVIVDAKNKLEAKNIELERLSNQNKKLESMLQDDSKFVKEQQRYSDLEKKYQQLVSELTICKSDLQIKDKSLQDMQKRLTIREADIKDKNTMIEKLKKEIDRYITENGEKKATIATLEKDLKALSKSVAETTTSKSHKEDLLKAIEQDFETQRSKIHQLESDLKQKNIEIIDMAKLADIGKRFEKIRADEGDCRLMGKVAMDQARDMQSKLHKDNKMLDDTVKKKNAKLLELFQEVDRLTAEINSRDVSSGNIAQERAKLQESLKNSETEKNRLLERLSKKESEVKYWKDKAEKLQQEAKAKADQLSSTQKKTQGLDGEIRTLKDQLDQKIHSMNNLNEKNSQLSEAEKRLREEQQRLATLERQNSDISGKLSQSETEIKELRIKIKQKEEELEKAMQENSRRGSMQDSELSDAKKTIAVQEKEIRDLSSKIDQLKDQERASQSLLMETSTKLKGALMRLDTAEKAMAKYDIENLDEKLKDLKTKGEAIGQAAGRIKTAMNALKISVLCRKCNKFPTNGKTLFPCGHCYCEGCFSDSATQCIECKQKADIQIKNPLIEELERKYTYMNDLVGFMIDSSSIFDKPSLV